MRHPSGVRPRKLSMILMALVTVSFGQGSQIQSKINKDDKRPSLNHIQKKCKREEGPVYKSTPTQVDRINATSVAQWEAFKLHYEIEEETPDSVLEAPHFFVDRGSTHSRGANSRLTIGTDCSGMETPLQALDNLGIEYDHVFSCDKDPAVRRFIEANFLSLIHI